MASSNRKLQRPKSTIFASAENRMKRLTHFLGTASTDNTTPQNAPPTPPLQPEAEEFLAAGAAKPRHGPNLTLAVPDGKPSLAYGQMDGSHGIYGAPRNYSTSNLLTPGSVTPTSSRHASAQFSTFAFDPQDPILQAPMAPFAASSRPGSRGSSYGSRPGTPGSVMGKTYASSTYSGVTPVSTEIPKLRKKRGGRKKDENSQLAWRMVAGSTTSLEQYDIAPLVRGEKSTDLWFPDGDMLVYLQPTKDSDKSKYSEPVFRIHSTPLIFAALNSCVEDLTLSQDQPRERPSEDGAFSPDDLFLEVPPPIGDRIAAQEPEAAPADAVKAPESPTSDSVKSPDAPISLRSVTSPQSPITPSALSDSRNEERPAIYKLYYPLDTEVSTETPALGKKKLQKIKHTKAEAEDTLQQYLDARNLFAFISRCFLVGSQRRDTPFQVLSKIYLQLGLHEAEMYPLDMQLNSRMFLAETHLQVYIDELVLDDIRNDDDLIMETLLLGEKWRSQRLYHEAFLHACGRWEDLKSHPGIGLISSATVSKLDRASIDLHQIRLCNIRTMIPNFEFPSVWVGCGRYSEFKSWKNAYDKMRAMVMAHMKHVFGSWPPRPGRTGKGGGYTATGGLNRVALKRLYDDLCAVYDLTVDREWIHGERIRGEGEEMSDALKSKQTTLRKIMQEFDSANVPCQPEMPFNLPRLPRRAPTAAKPKKRSFFSREKKISDAEIDAMLNESYNQDAAAMYQDNHFVKEYIATERAFALGKSVEELMDFRRGRWLFMYCVLQVLPMVVVDGVGLAHGDGVEYFLCENVKGGMPWDRGFNKRNTRMSGMWATGPDGSLVGMGASTSNLMAQVNPDDEVELIYRRSHCWEVSEAWRFVDGEDEDEVYHGQEIIGYEPDGQPIYAGEYVPSQQVPESPTMPAGSEAGYTANNSEANSLHLDGATSPAIPAHPQTAGPDWAERARQNYQSPPTVDTSGSRAASRSASRPGSSGSPVQGAPSNPLSPTDSAGKQLEPLDIQPFEFDLSPLEPKEKSPSFPRARTHRQKRTTHCSRLFTRTQVAAAAHLIAAECIKAQGCHR